MLSSIIGEQENCLDAGNLVGIKHHFTTKKKQQTGIGVLVFQFPLKYSEIGLVSHI